MSTTSPNLDSSVSIYHLNIGSNYHVKLDRISTCDNLELRGNWKYVHIIYHDDHETTSWIFEAPQTDIIGSWSPYLSYDTATEDYANQPNHCTSLCVVTDYTFDTDGYIMTTFTKLENLWKKRLPGFEYLMLSFDCACGSNIPNIKDFTFHLNDVKAD